MQELRDSDMLVSIAKIWLKSHLMLIYWDDLLSSSIRTIQGTWMHPHMQIRAVNVGLSTTPRKSSFIACTKGLCENCRLLASVSKTHCCGWGSQSGWCLAQRESGRTRGHQGARELLAQEAAFASGHCHTQWCRETYVSNRGRRERRKTKWAINISRKS